MKRMPARVQDAAANTIGGRTGTIGRLNEQRRFAEAYWHALDSMQHCERHHSVLQSLRFMDDLYWWFFFGWAFELAGKLGDAERRHVENLVVRAPGAGGNQEAVCLAVLARWRWDLGDRDQALTYARRAVLADPTADLARELTEWMEKQ